MLKVIEGGPEQATAQTFPEAGWPHSVASVRHQEVIAGRYRVGNVIGAGGMATVHEAMHVVTGRRLAVKFLRPEFRNDAASLARFEREAHAAGIIESENVISVLDFGYTKFDEPYIVMEYLSGESLSAFLSREAPLPVPFAVDVAIQACRGLAAAHAAGVVHRDVKPDNLFVCHHSDGTSLIKVFDFGIAKIMDDTRFRVGPRRPALGLWPTHGFGLPPAGGINPASFVAIEAGQFLGTAAYMSPEQIRGADGVDQRSDVYSVGGILFEMLSGETPHPGESFVEIIDHVLKQKPTRIETLRGTLPPSLAAIIHRALDADPRERFASALRLAAVLAPFAECRPATGEVD